MGAFGNGGGGSGGQLLQTCAKATKAVVTAAAAAAAWRLHERALELCHCVMTEGTPRNGANARGKEHRMLEFGKVIYPC